MEQAIGNWVGYGTVFYHERTGAFSTDIHQVIDYANLELDIPALAAYLDFGYSVFGVTPIKHVKYVLPHQSLILQEGKLMVRDGEDLTLQKLGRVAQEQDVLHRLGQDVNAWAERFPENIMIPTSGGFDSRLLNVLIDDKKRIDAFTYGISYHQNNSREAVYAQQLAERLKLRWKRIDLGQFNQYAPEWFDLFGPAVAATGTYQIEFYKHIQQYTQGRSFQLLSGIIGDAWAGAVSVPVVADATDYVKLGYTHGMHADSKRALSTDYMHLVEPIYDRQKLHLQDPSYRIITAMRTKIMYLQYLIKVPESLGYSGYSPFLQEDLALDMLNLPAHRRANRQWQRDFFQQHNILFEAEKHNYTYQNSLNLYGLLQERIEPLALNILQEYFHPNYLKWINDKMGGIGPGERFFQNLMHTPKVKGVMKMLGFKNELMQAYFAYLTIKPIEQLLKRRNNLYGQP